MCAGWTCDLLDGLMFPTIQPGSCDRRYYVSFKISTLPKQQRKSITCHNIPFYPPAIRWFAGLSQNPFSTFGYRKRCKSQAKKYTSIKGNYQENNLYCGQPRFFGGKPLAALHPFFGLFSVWALLLQDARTEAQGLLCDGVQEVGVVPEGPSQLAFTTSFQNIRRGKGDLQQEF